MVSSVENVNEKPTYHISIIIVLPVRLHARNIDQFDLRLGWGSLLFFRGGLTLFLLLLFFGGAGTTLSRSPHREPLAIDDEGASCLELHLLLVHLIYQIYL